MKKPVALVLVVGLLGVLSGYSPSARAEKEPAAKAANKDKIVGKWGFEKAVDKNGKPDKNAPPPGSTFEFTKDGVLKMTFKDPTTMKEATLSATYKVEGDKVNLVVKPAPNVPEEKETLTITTLTDKEMALKDSKGATATFKKK